MIEHLAAHDRILLDSCIWIYYLEDHPRYAAPIEILLRDSQRRNTHLLSSELSLLEIATGPLRFGKRKIAAEYQLYLDSYPGLQLLPISRPILEHASHLRARFGFKTPDAIILATGLEHGATLVVTNDQKWQRVEEIEVVCLDALS
jgi:predicted nucleic acid-binding protein